MGEKLCVVCSSEDVATIFKNPKLFTFEAFVRDVTLSFGVSPEIVDWMFHAPSESNAPQTSTSPNKHFIDRAHDYYKLQLHPGDKLDILQDKLLTNVDEWLQWKRFSDTFTLESSPDKKTVSLLGWCSDVLVSSATTAVFGKVILQIEPNLPQAIFDFDNENWKLNFKLPRVLAKEMYTAKQKIVDALQEYFRLPKEERSGESWIIDVFETEMREMGISDHQIALTLTMTLWVYV